MKKVTKSRGIGFGADLSRETKIYLDPNDKSKINRLSFRYVISVILLVLFVFSINNFTDYVIRYGAVHTRDYVNYTITEPGIDLTGFYAYREMDTPVMTLNEQFFERIDSITTLLSKAQINSDFNTWAKINMPDFYEFQFGNAFERAVWQVCETPINYFYQIFVRYVFIPEWIDIIKLLFF